MTATEEDGSSAGMVSQRAHIVGWRPLRTQLPICTLDPACVSSCSVNVSLWQRQQVSQQEHGPGCISQDPSKCLYNRIGALTLMTGMICARAWLIQPGSINFVQEAELMQAIRGCRGTHLHCRWLCT